MATEMHLKLVVNLLRRGRDLDRFSTVLTGVALLVGLAPLFGVARSLFAALLASALLFCGLVQSTSPCGLPWMPTCSPAWHSRHRPLT